MKTPGLTLFSVFLLAGCLDSQHGSRKALSTELQDEQQSIATATARVSENTREWHRDRISRTYLDMEEEIGLDKETRERLIDVLTDHHLYQLQRHTRADRESDRRRNAIDDANAITTELLGARELLGEEGLDRFHLYLKTRYERDMVRKVNRHLPAEEKLSPSQKEQLRELYSEVLRQLNGTADGDEWTRIQSNGITDEEEQRYFYTLMSIDRNEARLQRRHTLDAELESRAAVILSPKQLAMLKQVNERDRELTKRFIEEERATLDASKVDAMIKRIAKMPRVVPPAPVPGDVKVELNITIDDQEPVVATRVLRNGTAGRVTVGELIIQFTPTLYRAGPTLDLTYFSMIGGKLMELDHPSSFGIGDGRRFDNTEVVRGRDRGYLVRTIATVSKT